jgi:lysophospholipase L1-like esterase
MSRFLTALCLLALVPVSAAAEEKFFLQPGQRIVFLGDSNTYAGGFIAYLDGYLFTRFPDQKFELINLGLPSKTVSGLSEPDHPYPRPDVHERLDRALKKTKPDVVVICYGMNDGIYYPFSARRFAGYREGMESVIARVRRAGARVVLMTPAPFDPLPLRDKVLPQTAEKFSWMRPYEGYDDVLTRYSDWLLTLRDRGFLVVDAHAALKRHLARARRTEPRYHLSGDGIHPSATGHALIAHELLRAWHAPAEVDDAEIDLGAKKVIHGQVTALAVEGQGIRFTCRTHHPMPADPTWDRRFLNLNQLKDRLNRHRLIVRGAGPGRYELFEGDHCLGEVSGAQLQAGLDLTAIPDLSTNRESPELGKLARERQQILGLAWLTDVGHKRPDTPKGLPLAEAQHRTAALEARMRKLAQPVALHLRLVGLAP